jgi:hypothetical protein
MKLADATNTNRKFGKPRDLRFSFPTHSPLRKYFSIERSVVEGRAVPYSARKRMGTRAVRVSQSLSAETRGIDPGPF